MEWTECVTECGSTCESLAVVGSAGSCFLTAADCLPGCQCRPGTVYDRSVGELGSCVAPTDCACVHKGERYPAGTTIPVECNEWSVPRIGGGAGGGAPPPPMTGLGGTMHSVPPPQL